MHDSKPIQKSLSYIRENLTKELSLEALASHAYFSPYYFHRLFVLHTGEAPMEFIRRLRLREAAQELLSGSLRIIEIAAKYRFESQDGFARAFKKYYGLSPDQYRKLNQKWKAHASLENKEEKNPMYEMNLFEKLICSPKDKKESSKTASCKTDR